MSFIKGLRKIEVVKVAPLGPWGPVYLGQGLVPNFGQGVGHRPATAEAANTDPD